MTAAYLVVALIPTAQLAPENWSGQPVKSHVIISTHLSVDDHVDKSTRDLRLADQYSDNDEFQKIRRLSHNLRTMQEKCHVSLEQGI
jgi:hypothetical protein